MPRSLILLLILAGMVIAAEVPSRKEAVFGVNLAGAEFAPHQLPGKEDVHWGWPSEACIEYWHQAGVRLIRLPFLWERLQPVLMQDLDPTYAAGLAKTVALLRARAMMVILDVHNYARYRRDLIGSPAVPVAAFQDLWKRLAIIHKDEPHVWGYGLMNEPGNGKAWKDAAQAAIDGIRSVDRWTQILVANDYPGWGATAANRKPGLDLATWAEGGMPIPIPSLLRDPSDNLRFELHTYFDHDNSGTYRVPYEKEIVRTDGPGHRVMPEIGIQRMKPFVEWLRRHKVRGFIGEYSAPANAGVDPRWLDILDRTMAYMQENNLPSTYWAGGQRWSQGNPMIIEPSGWLASLPDGERLRERPQLTLLRKYATAPTDHGMQEGRRAPWMKP